MEIQFFPSTYAFNRDLLKILTISLSYTLSVINRLFLSSVGFSQRGRPQFLDSYGERH
jgi:hypothetical protein